MQIKYKFKIQPNTNAKINNIPVHGRILLWIHMVNGCFGSVVRQYARLMNVKHEIGWKT